jgi:threonine/homoserine/homoserine lactone efflux protein
LTYDAGSGFEKIGARAAARRCFGKRRWCPAALCCPTMAFPQILSFFLKGAAIGLSIAAPVGPIGVLCIRRTLQYGSRDGLACGLGAAGADAIYGTVAAFGLTAVSDFLVAQTSWLSLGGGVFLCLLGLRTMLSRPVPEVPQCASANIGSSFGTTLALTLTNPMTILSFVAVFAGFGLARSPSFATAGSLVAGVFIGSALWWLLLTGTVSRLRRRISDRAMRLINQGSGGVILAFGIYALRLWYAHG